MYEFSSMNFFAHNLSTAMSMSIIRGNVSLCEITHQSSARMKQMYIHISNIKERNEWRKKKTLQSRLSNSLNHFIRDKTLTFDHDKSQRFFIIKLYSSFSLDDERDYLNLPASMSMSVSNKSFFFSATTFSTVCATCNLINVSANISENCQISYVIREIFRQWLYCWIFQLDGMVLVQFSFRNAQIDLRENSVSDYFDYDRH